MNIATYATGLQHIGIPTTDLEGSERFYTDLGFRVIHRAANGDERVIFLELAGLVVEIWTGAPTGRSGAIDHFALDVTDIDAVFQTVTAAGAAAIEGEVRQLPFWERGVRYFTILGPNAEKIEFIQKL